MFRRESGTRTYDMTAKWITSDEVLKEQNGLRWVIQKGQVRTLPELDTGLLEDSSGSCN